MPNYHTTFRQFTIRLMLILAIALASGCAVKFAPAFDQSISDSLNSANKDMQTLFSSIPSSGVKESTFKSRQESYAKVLGELKAAQLQITARLNPATPDINEVNKFLKSISAPALVPTSNVVPSAGSVASVIDTITVMQSHDQSSGLLSGDIKAFQGQANIYMTQALAYENFLKR